MNISTLRDGMTYVGFSCLMTTEEWSQYCKWMFNHAEGDPNAERIPYERAEKMGGEYTGSCYEHGPGFVFPNETPESLERTAKSLFPWLF